MIDFSFSTVWNSDYAQDAVMMVEEIKRMGFNNLELNFTLTSKDICDIIAIKDRAGIKITGLHNTCPIPEGISPKKASPDYYSLASLNEAERSKAIEAAKTTIRTADKLDAPYVILHTGYVDIRDKTRRLAANLDNKKYFERVKAAMDEERAGCAPRHLEKAILSLEELLDLAGKLGITLGIENRYYYREIPSLDEIGVILTRLGDNRIGYWHDVGHAQIFENIGVAKHKDYLDRYGPRIVGIHLHDIYGIDDHRAPLMGNFDFAMIKPYIKEDTCLVLEIHHPATPQEIKEGVKYLKKLYGR